MRSRPLALLLLAALAAVLAGCGGGGGAKSSTALLKVPTAAAKHAVEEAATKTERSSADVQIVTELRKPGSPATAAYQADGVVVPTGGRIVIDRTSLGANKQTEIFLHEHGHLVLYTNPAAMALPQGKTWLKVDMTRFGKKRYGTDTTFLAGADQDPEQALELLRSPAAKVRELGLDWLADRTLNTRYQAKVSLSAAVKAAGATKAGLAHLVADMGEATQTIDVWVDKQGRVAQITVAGPQHAPDGSTLQVKSIADFTKYGKKAAVSAPPAKKVADYFTLIAK